MLNLPNDVHVSIERKFNGMNDQLLTGFSFCRSTAGRVSKANSTINWPLEMPAEGRRPKVLPSMTSSRASNAAVGKKKTRTRRHNTMHPRLCISTTKPLFANNTSDKRKRVDEGESDPSRTAFWPCCGRIRQKAFHTPLIVAVRRIGLSQGPSRQLTVSVPTQYRQYVKNAINFWQNNTCLRFIEKPSSTGITVPFILFTRGAK